MTGDAEGADESGRMIFTMEADMATIRALGGISITITPNRPEPEPEPLPPSPDQDDG